MSQGQVKYIHSYDDQGTVLVICVDYRMGKAKRLYLYDEQGTILGMFTDCDEGIYAPWQAINAIDYKELGQIMEAKDSTQKALDELENSISGEGLNFQMTLPMTEEFSGKIWDMIRAAREAEESVEGKLKELTEALERTSEAWNKMAELASEAVKKKRAVRYKPGVYIRKELTNVSDPRRVLDRLAQENKPPGRNTGCRCEK